MLLKILDLIYIIGSVVFCAICARYAVTAWQTGEILWLLIFAPLSVINGINAIKIAAEL